jgi:hypothetical protein
MRKLYHRQSRKQVQLWFVQFEFVRGSEFTNRRTKTRSR